ncbi:cupin domain-containing protein [Seohaeicola nanhaiensis]|uniref:Cupin domain-containing protein n=1 Tax=Seohaeicola nanhaiensis TaxID=1387282 RepID=A0ABV9KJE7_9RHOB
MTHSPTRANDANHYLWGEACDGWRLTDHPDLALREERLPPGTAEAPHFHIRSRQIFYVLAGVLSIDLPGRTLIATPGEAVEISPGLPHLVANRGTDDLRLLLVSAPDTAVDRHPAPAPLP